MMLRVMVYADIVSALWLGFKSSDQTFGFSGFSAGMLSVMVRRLG